jgi:hypothetical protein
VKVQPQLRSRLNEFSTHQRELPKIIKVQKSHLNFDALVNHWILKEQNNDEYIQSVWWKFFQMVPEIWFLKSLI